MVTMLAVVVSLFDIFMGVNCSFFFNRRINRGRTVRHFSDHPFEWEQRFHPVAGGSGGTVVTSHRWRPRAFGSVFTCQMKHGPHTHSSLKTSHEKHRHQTFWIRYLTKWRTTKCCWKNTTGQKLLLRCKERRRVETFCHMERGANSVMRQLILSYSFIVMFWPCETTLYNDTLFHKDKR